MPTVSGSQSIYAGEEWNILGEQIRLLYLFMIYCAFVIRVSFIFFHKALPRIEALW